MRWLKFADKSRNMILAGILLLNFFCVQAQQQNSVLRNGNWLKIAVTETGVYQLDAAALAGMGWNVSQMNPAGFRLFGNGGRMLPQAIADFRESDLTENAVWVTGQEDGKFDATDRIFFYAEGTGTVHFDQHTRQLFHETNFYSDTSYYFLTYTDTPGLRIAQAPVIESQSAAVTISEFTDYWYYEKESVNLLESGREWWGDYIAARPTGWQVKLKGIIPGSQAMLTNQLIAGAHTATSASWRVNTESLGNQAISSVPEGRYAQKARKSFQKYSFQANPLNDILYFEVMYDNKGQGSAQAYLDYFSVQMQRYLDGYEEQQRYFFLPAENDTVRYAFGENTLADWIVWDVTDLHRPTVLSWEATGKTTRKTKGGMRFRNLHGFAQSGALKPVRIHRIANQDIRNLKTPELLIVTAPMLKTEAERLAAFRRSHDNMEVEVVSTAEIYHEFSSGKQDVSAIRDFVRWLYQQNPEALKYLLLFGDASFDFRNLKNVNQPSWQLVPAYQSRESLDPVYSYASDDYYGFLKETDGSWAENPSGDHLLDISVGRLPLKNPYEAGIVVDKLIHYGSSSRTWGKWRNKAAFVADDGDGNLHQGHASSLALLAEETFLPELLFSDAYPSVTTGGGRKIPAMNSAILDLVKQGAAIINFSGHGDASGWTQEQIFTLEEIQKARGYDNLPLFMTATCEFGRFDNPWVVSGAEQLVLSPRGGAIGAVTTTRPVYASNNFALNQAFYTSVAEAGRQARIGDIVRKTKNTSLKGSLNRNFTLLGDPSMRLARAAYEVRWVTAEPDTLKPLEMVMLEGGIYEEGSDTPADWFNGTARVSVFDQKQSFKTLGNGGDPAASYSHFVNQLFEGNVTVINGKFTIHFRVPAEITETYGPGRVSVYAIDEDSLSDASAQLMVITGGNTATENKPASWMINGYVDSPQFINGDKVADNPVLFVTIQSEGGLNLTGKGITGLLNDTTEIQFNNYYSANAGDFTKGTLQYQFGSLAEGKYTLKLLLTDLYNNKTERTFEFLVGKPSGIVMKEAIIYPNPFEVTVGYLFTHNREGDDIQATFKIFNPSGELLFTHYQTYYNSAEKLGISFQPFGSNQKYLSYLYELSIQSLTDGTRNRRSGWLLQKL